MKRLMVCLVAGALLSAHAAAAHPSGTRAALAGKPRIAFVNPSGYSEGNTMADSTDTDGRYHVVAWAGDAPGDALVEFEVQAPGRNASTFLASPAGNGTWEMPLDLEAFVDGPTRSARACTTARARARRVARSRRRRCPSPSERNPSFRCRPRRPSRSGTPRRAGHSACGRAAVPT